MGLAKGTEGTRVKTAKRSGDIRVGSSKAELEAGSCRVSGA